MHYGYQSDVLFSRSCRTRTGNVRELSAKEPKRLPTSLNVNPCCLIVALYYYKELETAARRFDSR
jgi:hypothetical protein